MKLSELSTADVAHRLRRPGLSIRTGPFHFRIVSPIASVAEGLQRLYADYELVDSAEFVDFTVTLAASGGLRRWWRSQVKFIYDGEQPFLPLPIDHAFALLESAMNWCISTQANHYLTLHAAALERDGCGVILPAAPGAGKSTLCAGLASRGWRLLSDELTLISPSDGLLAPLGRPISLKNQSLDVIRKVVPGAVLNRVTHDTAKGSVAHMKVAAADVARLNERARPRWVIFPRYVAGARAELRVRSKAASMLELGRHSFNYPVFGLRGFELLADLVSASDCHDFRYSQLEEAVAVFERLAQQEAPA